MKIEKIGNLSENARDRETERVYSRQGLSPTLNTCGGGWQDAEGIDLRLSSTRQEAEHLPQDGVRWRDSKFNNNN